ncbi:universal stress protein [Anaerobacillus isosaccharinicus]|uniref:Histidine kinase n=1 Tax=Anaerobacillus isosaccharinicus TaxID=1532552 RepID=A0A1S2M959_9BACI|nr:universal stress protein [Anaerobacillus isosaccharinicus]MBA5588616.1 universal stress protein [Anaerobacillus isosaccharinicus]QOY37973.1 universal stress protein [Anaerobacillus isosaccharinicus]
MQITKGRMDESILVCVYYGPNGERLIKRGCKIASMMDCPLYILTVDPKPFDELDAEKSEYITKWGQLAKEHNAKFILKDNDSRPVTKVIAEVARERHITQIILGQTAQSRWEQITKGSIINVLLREIPFVDLHVISVARALKEDHGGHFEKGVRAYLKKEGNQYKISFNHTPEIEFEGIFFKEVGTDFNNGVFKFMKNNETMQVHVTDDYVTELKNVSMTTPIENDLDT